MLRFYDYDDEDTDDTDADDNDDDVLYVNNIDKCLVIFISI